MIGFRNMLVYEYLDVDRKVTYDVLQHQLGDLRALGKDVRSVSVIQEPLNRELLGNLVWAAREEVKWLF